MLIEPSKAPDVESGPGSGHRDVGETGFAVTRGLRRHTLYLEELTHQIAADWLDYRHRRWPASTNPHLL